MVSGEEKDKREHPPPWVDTEKDNDAEELRAIGDLVKSVGDLLREIVGFIRQVMDEILDSIKGDKLGAEVAAFYSQLRDAGMPEDMIASMTREYFEKRIAIAELVKMLPQLLQNQLGGARPGAKPKTIMMRRPDTDVKIEFADKEEEAEKGGDESRESSGAEA